MSGESWAKQINVLNKQSEKSELGIDVETERARRTCEKEEERGRTRDHDVKSERTSSGKKSG